MCTLDTAWGTLQAVTCARLGTGTLTCCCAVQVSIEDIDSDALVRNTAFSNKAYKPGPTAVQRTRLAAFDLVTQAYNDNLVSILTPSHVCCGCSMRYLYSKAWLLPLLLPWLHMLTVSRLLW